MYAILRQGGHQYRVSPGDTIQVELLSSEAGSEVELEDVLMLHDGQNLEVGTPRVANATVKAKVVREDRGPKIIVYKFRRRKGYSQKKGHRQSFTELRITGICRNGTPINA